MNQEKQANVLIINPVGRIDSVSSGEFEVRILRLIDHGEHNLVINLSQVDFVSSAGLRVFLMTAKKLQPVNGKVALCNVIPEVKEVFDISGFSSMFAIKPSVQEAMALF